MSHRCNTVNISARVEVSRLHSELVLFSSSSERFGIMQLCKCMIHVWTSLWAPNALATYFLSPDFRCITSTKEVIIAVCLFVCRIAGWGMTQRTTILEQRNGQIHKLWEIGRYPWQWYTLSNSPSSFRDLLHVRVYFWVSFYSQSSMEVQFHLTSVCPSFESWFGLSVWSSHVSLCLRGLSPGTRPPSHSLETLNWP